MPLKLLVIIPCYNEQAALPQLLQAFNEQHLSGYQTELLVVNDSSADDTAALAIKHGADLLDLPINLGIGGAVQSGLLYAQKHHFDLAVQMDGDGQHQPEELSKLLNCYQQTGANLIIGSRFIEHKGYLSTFARRLGISWFRYLIKLLTGSTVYDSTSGFRLFDKKAIAFGADHYPDEYPEPESLIMFLKAGLSICETPVQMAPRNGGRSSIRNFASLYYCIKVTIAMLFSAVRKI